MRVELSKFKSLVGARGIILVNSAHIPMERPWAWSKFKSQSRRGECQECQTLTMRMAHGLEVSWEVQGAPFCYYQSEVTQCERAA